MTVFSEFTGTPGTANLLSGFSLPSSTKHFVYFFKFSGRFLQCRDGIQFVFFNDQSKMSTLTFNIAFFESLSTLFISKTILFHVNKAKFSFKLY